MGQVTDALAGPYSRRSVSAWTRNRRWNEVLRRFPDLDGLRVVDLGGDVRHWSGAPVQPKEIVFVNLFWQQVDQPGHRVVVGDACDVPAELSGERFDLVYCNSVIEHVGGHLRRSALAGVVHELADRHWVQTPYRYFPMEPHWVFPGFQFLPFWARVEITRRWPLGHHRVSDRAKAAEYVARIDLLSRTEMSHYFPTSEIWAERLAGLTKSLVAIRD
jgi:hypothetical protein